VNALDELRESLREAARRDVEADRSRHRRRRRRATGIVILALFGGAAAAGAADLISVGEPVREPSRSSAYRPGGATQLQIALTARSEGKLPYGVLTYTARNGDRCALAGVIRGAQLGLMEGGKFRPFTSDRTGACRSGTKLFNDFAVLGDRTLVYGRAAPSTRFVRVEATDRRVRVGPGGAFLFVFDALPKVGFKLLEE
jgi:hypothetical protein